ncbi:MAG: hypothetical protein PHF84_03085 [bacterium]|nr:hypothetical protein [bacterium]
MKYKIIFIICFVFFFIVLYNVSKAKETWENISLKEGLPNKFIKDIKSDGENIYIATANGLGIYNIRNKKIRIMAQKDGLADNYISAIDIDNNDIWLGTDKGLSLYNKRTGKILNYTKKDGLVDDAISAVLVDEDYVWVGTKYWGISRFDKSINRWQNFSVINGLVDNSINCFEIDSGYIWIGTKNGLSYYDKVTGLLGGYDTTQGLSEGNIRSIRVVGQYIWLGTVNGLIRFDKYEETFKTYTTTDGLADDFIQSLNMDGTFLWIGTFSGVTKYDLMNDKWFTYTIKDGLIENSVSAVEIDGNYIWFGTDGGGISRMDKEIAEASISPFSFYSSPGNISILGTAYHYDDIKNYTIEYKNDAMKSYMSTGIRLNRNNNVLMQKLAEWDVSKLLNISYDVKLTVTDRKGKVNTAISTFIIDTKPPQLTLDPLPEAVNAPSVYVKGTYIDDNIREIIITVNEKTKEKANLDRMVKRYNKELQLSSGINQIEITAYDIANQSTKIKTALVYDKEKPAITLDDYPKKASTAEITFSGTVMDSGIQRIVLNPGNLEIPFTKTEENRYTFKYAAGLQPGFNKFEISVYDFVGNKASIEPVVDLQSTVPLISLNKNTLKVSSEDFEVTGSWTDDNLDSIIIEPFNMKAVIDPKNQKFSLKVKLNKGENVITANILDSDKNKNFDVMTILYSTETSKLELAKIQEFINQSVLNIEGYFFEPNLKNIVVNPGGINMALDQANNKFSGVLNLNPGLNSFEIVMQDKFNIKSSKKFKIILDAVPPELNLEKVPSTVYSGDVNITGRFTDDYIDKIVIMPDNIICKLDMTEKKFSADLEITEGPHTIDFIATDKAGNKTSVERTITYVPAVISKEGADSEYVKQLKNEIERLKALLKQQGGTVTAVREQEYQLPSPSGLALVAYNRLKVNTFLDISKKYLGGIIHLDFLNRYNNINILKPDNLVLIPTRNYIKTYLNTSETRIREILDMIALSYRYSFMNYSDFKKRLGLYLLNRNYINQNELNALVSNNYLSGDGFTVSINKSVKTSTGTAIQIRYSGDFISVQVKKQGVGLSRSE